MKKILWLFIVTFMVLRAEAQLEIGWGTALVKLQNAQLSSLTFGGESFLNFGLGYTKKHRQWSFRAELEYANSVSKPLGINSLYYSENQLTQHEYRIQLIVGRSVCNLWTGADLHLSVGVESWLEFEKQSYSSNLYTYGSGWRKSYAMVPCELTSGLEMRQSWQAHSFGVGFSGSLAGWSIRTDDNYIKQLGFPSEFQHGATGFLLPESRAYVFRCNYRYAISPNLAISVQVLARTRIFPKPNSFHYQRNSLSVFLEF
jgi:hypothetical protein